MGTEYRGGLARDPLPLRGRSIVVTGVSRRAGIGFATACRLAAYGANLFCHHYGPHDEQQPWGGDDIEALLEELRGHLTADAQVGHWHADLAEADNCERLIDLAATRFGKLDGLICNQAQSGSDGKLGQLTVVGLNRHWAVNARASLLLAQEFARRHMPGESGSIVFLTSGQGLGPMPGEVGYAASKAAIAGITATLSDQLADEGIRVNTVNPGTVDTGYLTDEMRRRVAPKFPLGRYGSPDDAARLIAWLLTDEASWLTGQVINSEGGFGRWRPSGPD